VNFLSFFFGYCGVKVMNEHENNGVYFFLRFSQFLVATEEKEKKREKLKQNPSPSKFFFGWFTWNAVIYCFFFFFLFLFHWVN